MELQSNNEQAVKKDLTIDKSKEPIFIELAHLEMKLDKYLENQKKILTQSNNELVDYVNKFTGKTIISKEISPNLVKVLDIIKLVATYEDNYQRLYNDQTSYILNKIELNRDKLVDQYGEEFINHYKSIQDKFSLVEKYNNKLSEKMDNDLPMIGMSKLVKLTNNAEFLVEKLEPCLEILMQDHFAGYVDELKDFASDNLPIFRNETLESSSDILI